MKLELGEVSVVSLLAQTAEMFRAPAIDKGILLTVEECPSDLMVNADAERVMQVLSNLVGNALKFVPGRRFISLCRWRANTGSSALQPDGSGKF